MDLLIKVADAARMLGVSKQSVRNYEERGWLPSLRSEGNHRLYKVSDVKALHAALKELEEMLK